LIGAEAVFLYQNQELFAGRAKGALQQIIAVAVINLLIGLSPGIDNWGHVGGLIGGTLFALMAGPRLRIEGFPPFASLKDERENGSVIAASLAVGVLFVAIAGAVIYMHIG
jgi:rhomboid protease GluP